MATRKNLCVQYFTGNKVKGKNGKTYDETKLLTVGSAFVDEESGRINGTFRAIPPQWDGRFVILDPLPARNERVGEETEDVLADEPY